MEENIGEQINRQFQEKLQNKTIPDYEIIDAKRNAVFKKLVTEMENFPGKCLKKNKKTLHDFFVYIRNLCGQHFDELSELRANIDFTPIQSDGGMAIDLDVFIRLTDQFIEHRKKISFGRFIKRLQVLFEIFLKCRSTIISMNYEKDQLEKVLKDLATSFFTHGEARKGLECLLELEKLCELSCNDEAVKWLMYYDEIELIREKFKSVESKKYLIAYIGIPYCNSLHRCSNVVPEIQTLFHVHDTSLPKLEKETVVDKDNCGKCAFLAMENVKSYRLLVSWTIMRIVQRDACLQIQDLETEKIPLKIMLDMKRLLHNFDWSYAFKATNVFAANARMNKSADLMSDLAWTMEVYRQFALLQTIGTQPHLAYETLLFLWCNALLVASPFQILKIAKDMLVHVLLRKEDKWEEKAQLLRNIIRKLTRPNDDDPTALRGEKEEMALNKFHDISENCGCLYCAMYGLSEEFAAEYLFARLACQKFSQKGMTDFVAEYPKVKSREEAIKMEGGKEVQNKTNISLIYHFAVRFYAEDVMRRWELEGKKSKISPEKLLRNWETYLPEIPEYATNMIYTFKEISSRFFNPLPVKYPWTLFDEKDYSRNAGADLEVRFPAIPVKDVPEVMSRELTFRRNSFLGQFQNNSWNAAYHFAESTSFELRTNMQIKMETETIARFEDEADFKKHVKAMPENITVVQIAMTGTGDVCLIKLHSDRDPIIQPLICREKLEKLRRDTEILRKSEAFEGFASEGADSTHEQVTLLARNRIEEAKLNFINNFEKKYLDASANLLIPSRKLKKNGKRLAVEMEFITKGAIKAGEAKELIFQTLQTSHETWIHLLNRHCGFRGVGIDQNEKLLENYSDYLDAMEREIEFTKDKRMYTILVVCPELAHICWESLPVLADYPFVSRMTSIHLLFEKLKSCRDKGVSIPLEIDIENCEHLIGEDTKNKTAYCALPGKRIMKPCAVQKSLEKSDIFFYYGDSASLNMILSFPIRETKCKAVCGLMSSRSIHVEHEGLGYEGKSIVNEYALADCPLLIGYIWSACSADIAKCMKLMGEYIETKKKKNVPVHIAEIVHHGRTKTMKRLNNFIHPLVTYGLPVVIKNSSNK